MDNYINLFKYGMQSPYISFIHLPKKVRKRIYEESLNFWDIILPKTEGPSLGFRYFPVLTIFASEQAVKRLNTFGKIFLVVSLVKRLQ